MEDVIKVDLTGAHRGKEQRWLDVLGPWRRKRVDGESADKPAGLGGVLGSGTAVALTWAQGIV